MQDTFGNKLTVGSFVAFSVMSNVTGIRNLSFGVITPQFERNTPRKRVMVLPALGKDNEYMLRSPIYITPQNLLKIDHKIMPSNLYELLQSGYKVAARLVAESPDKKIQDSRSSWLWGKDYSKDLGISNELYNEMQESLKAA